MSNNLFSADAQAQLKALKKQLTTRTTDTPSADTKPDQPNNLPSQKHIDKQVRQHLARITNQANLEKTTSVTAVDTDALADELLFKQAMHGVTPLAQKNNIAPDQLNASKTKHKQTKQHASTLAKRAAAEGGDEVASDLPISDMQAMLNPVAAEAYLMYKNPTLQHRVFSQLKEGKLRWFEAVDIHGSSIEEARHAVMKVIQITQDNGHTVLKIVHGKGATGSKDKQAILKTCVNGWLRQYPDVLAFCSATPKDGGTGAVVVLIKRPEQNKVKHR